MDGLGVTETMETHMDDFIHRTISKEISVPMAQNVVGKIKVMRTRTSAGHAQITAEFNDQRIEFKGENYEQNANDFIAALDEVCGNPCLLPTL